MKKVLIVIAVLAVFAAASFASQSAVLSLGVPVWMTQDEVLSAVLFPEMVIENNNLAVAEAIPGVGYYGRLNLGLGDGVLGIIANVPIGSSIAPGSLVTSGAIYGLSMKGMNVGLGVYYGSTATKNLTGATFGSVGGSYTSTHASNIGILAGVSMGTNNPIDIGVRVNMPNNYTADYITKDAAGLKIAEGKTGTTGLELGADVRAGLSDMLVNVGFSMVNSAYQATARTYDAAGVVLTSTQNDTTGSNMTVSLGCVKQIKVEAVTVLFGLNPYFNTTSSKIKNKDLYGSFGLAGDGNSTSSTTINVPVYVGAEGRLNETWVLRGGVSKSLWGNGQTVTVTKDPLTGNTLTNTTADTSTAPQPGITLGIGGKIGDVTVDGQVGTSILLNGPFFISGTPTANMIANVGISYRWK